MKYFAVFALLATLAIACSATPLAVQRGYDQRCYRLPTSITQPAFETADFRDCLNRQPCNRGEICCPKRLGGGKCIRLPRSFHKRETPQYDQKCFTLPASPAGEPIFETTVFRDCLTKEPCAQDEICCPKSVGGGKCIKNAEFEKVEQTKKYDQKCFSIPLIGNNPDEVETLEFTDCLKDPCSDGKVCCPKKTGGSKCVDLPKSSSTSA